MQYLIVAAIWLQLENPSKSYSQTAFGSAVKRSIAHGREPIGGRTVSQILEHVQNTEAAPIPVELLRVSNLYSRGSRVEAAGRAIQRAVPSFHQT